MTIAIGHFCFDVSTELFEMFRNIFEHLVISLGHDPFGCI